LLYFVIQLVSYHFSSLIKEFDHILKDDESKNPPEINKQLNDRKQFMVGELLNLCCISLAHSSNVSFVLYRSKN
jgi:hypothetical protein